MTAAEQALQDALLTTYYANLLFLKESDYSLYERIENLSTLIGNGEYKERYQLKFLSDKGDFDIYDSKHGQHLYNENPKKFNLNAAKRVNLKAEGSISILENELYLKPRIKIPEYDECDSFKIGHSLLFNDIADYKDVLGPIELNKEYELKNIEKFIFIGTLLGRHIEEVVKKVKAKNYFVCEPNLEIFRLSLFVFDYTALLNNSNVMFSVMDDDEVLFHKLNSFLETNPFENHTVKFYTTDYNVEGIFEQAANAMLNQKPTTFNHHMLLENIAGNAYKKINKHKILLLDKKETRSLESFSNYPVLFVGAGPSTVEYLEWINENQNRFIIVAMGAVYKKLLEEGINPDIITTLDPNYEVIDKLHFSEDDCKKLQDTYIFSSINSSSKIDKRFNQDKLFMFEVINNIKENNQIFQGISIGEMTFSILLSLGCKDIYLVGTDLAVNQKTGSTHFKKYDSTREYDLQDVNKYEFLETGSYSYRDDLIEVEGNLDKTVYTSRVFNNSLMFYRNNIKYLKMDDQKVYNLCTHGAYINDTIPTKQNDIKLDKYKIIDKKELDKVLEKDLSIISSSKLTVNEIKRLKEERSFILELRDQVLKLQKEKSSKTYADFYNKYKELFDLMRNESTTYYLREVLKLYTNTINTTLSYYLKNKNIKKEKEKVKKSEDIWEKQFIKIIDRYLELTDRIEELK